MMNASRKAIEHPVIAHWGLPLLVLALALLPRALSPDAFLTADEDDQLQFAARFLQAVERRDWGGALVLGYPGVPTMALGGLGLWAQRQLEGVNQTASGGLLAPPVSPVAAPPSTSRLPHRVYLPMISNQKPSPAPPPDLWTVVRRQPLRYIAAARLPLAVLASLGVVLVFLLLRRLLPARPALLATLLIAFEPMFVAHSRIIHVDGPLTAFMFPSFLAFLVYLKKGRWGWLAASGLLGGLAVLSKTPGVILGPVLAVGGYLFARFAFDAAERPVLLRRWMLALLGWGVVAAISFVVFWPSMWARPVFALTWLINNARGALNTPHPSSGLFWGRLVTDRSPWYYLVALPFYLTPLTTLGGPAGLWLAATGWRDRRRGRDTFARRQLPLLLASLAFVIIFLAVVSVVARRGVRYLLPIFPAFDVLAAVGLWGAARRIAPRRGRWLLAGAVAAQLATVLAFHPYYFHYFNPLLGGGRTAPQYVVIGWGEGLDRAADYLNRKPGASRMTVAAWYSWQFAPYFKGQTVDLSGNQPAYRADYTLFYINQVQRRFPSEELLDYFDDRLPEKVITLGGVDYVWIYPGPIIGRTPPKMPGALNISFGKGVTLINYQVSIITYQSSIINYQSSIPVTLYWRVNAPLPPDLNVSIRAVDGEGVIWGQVDRLPIGGLVRTDKWRPGDIIRDEYMLPLDPAAPPGEYTFDILLYNFETGEIFGQARGVGSRAVAPPAEPPDLNALPIAHRVEAVPAQGLRLLGHTFKPLATLPGYRHTFKLYWRADPRPAADYALTLAARAASGDEIPLLNRPIGPAEYPTGAWRRGETLAEAVAFAFPLDAPPGAYTLLARVGDSAGVELGRVTLDEPPHVFTLPPEAQPGDARFGADGEIALAGYSLAQAGDALALTLYWRAGRTPADELKVFVHVTAADGRITAQRDAIPAGGTRPTPTWLPGEIIADPYRIPLPPGTYTLGLGLYNPLDGQRLPAASSAPVSDNRVRLAVVEVGE
ncbi:MAG: ArnT family glycosyltransferase [Anaerolineae bacterium]